MSKFDRPGTDELHADLIQRVRVVLDARVEALDGTTLGRLRAARRSALQSGSAGRVWLRRLLPAGGLLAAGLLALMLWPTPPPPAAGLTAQAVDFEMLTSDAGLDLYQNMAFYVWLQSRTAPGRLDLGPGARREMRGLHVG